VSVVTSRDNPRVRRWRGLARDARERRKARRAIIEGENLVRAFIASGRAVECLLIGKSAAAKGEFADLEKKCGKAATVLADAVFRSIVDVETPAGIAAEIAIPSGEWDLKIAANCLFLDAVQDAGNVGAILRSAAAFGIRHAVLGKGCADAWSPKVLRAAAGAHFVMEIVEVADLAETAKRFGGKLVCTAPRGGGDPEKSDLSGRVGWLFGSEGQGLGPELMALADLKITIPMQGAQESLNVAAAAAICFYEFSRRGARA
jgi:TrmH family RNA methyltransferase